MGGFGEGGFGGGPFGVGTPASAPVPVDPPAGARWLDPRTKDWKVESDGTYARMPAVRQQVLLAVSTVRKSSTIEPGRGVLMPRKKTESFATQTRVAVQNALRFLISAGKIRLLSVDVDADRLPGRARITISYFDLTLDREDSVVV